MGEGVWKGFILNLFGQGGCGRVRHTQLTRPWRRKWEIWVGGEIR